MKRKKIPVLLLTAVCWLAMLPTAAVATTAAEPATQTETTLSDTELVDSGISYVETVETIANPGAGYTTTDWYTCAPGNTPIHDKNGSFVLMFIPLISFAQTYKYIGIEDGLSNRRIFDIQKDSKGYMWFLTNEGMDRYDGKEIRHYKLLDESKSLTSSIYLGWLYKGDVGRLRVIS